MTGGDAESTVEDQTDTRRRSREEAAIARRYIGRVPWEMVAWGLGNVLGWLALWPLVLGGWLPLWAGFGLATLFCVLAYLPSHEAQHSIIAAEGTRLRWLNELVGHVSTIPLAFPYRVGWITHKQHHAHANDDVLDPDISSRADRWWQAAWQTARARQPGSSGGYARCMRETDDPNRDRALFEALVMRVFHFGVLTAFAWSGHAIEAALLWWIPRHLGQAYIVTFLSWAPHHPMREKGRYRDTRAWRSPVGTMLSMGMEYHLVHHLYPKIPLFDTGRAFRALEPLLLEQGIRDDRTQSWEG